MSGNDAEYKIFKTRDSGFILFLFDSYFYLLKKNKKK